MRGVCFDFQGSRQSRRPGTCGARRPQTTARVGNVVGPTRTRTPAVSWARGADLLARRHRELRRMFAANRGVGRTRVATRSLLTGFVRCGKCGQGMFTSSVAHSRRRYACSTRPSNTNCGGVTTLADPLDEVVAEMVFAGVDDAALASALQERGVTDDGLLASVQRD